MSDYEDMQNGLKQFGKKVIDILCDCYCDLIEEHYYRDTRCVNQNSNPAAAAAGWIRVEWRGTEYTLPIGINYDMEPAICFDMEGDHWEDETHAWMFIASRTFDKLRAQEARVAELEKNLEAVRDAECGKCGRSLAPDGDCHGCRADRLEVEVERLKTEQEAHDHPTGLVHKSAFLQMEARAEAAEAERDALKAENAARVHLQKNMAKENIALRKQIEGVREWAKHNWADGMGAALEQLSAALAEKEE